MNILKQLSVKNVAKNDGMNFLKQHVSEEEMQTAIRKMKRGGSKGFHIAMKAFGKVDEKTKKLYLLSKMKANKNLAPYENFYLSCFLEHCILHVDQSNQSEDISDEQLFKEVVFKEQVQALDQGFVLAHFNLASDHFTEEQYVEILEQSKLRKQELDDKHNAKVNQVKIEQFDAMFDELTTLTNEHSLCEQRAKDALRFQKNGFEAEIKKLQQEHVQAIESYEQQVKLLQEQIDAQQKQEVIANKTLVLDSKALQACFDVQVNQTQALKEQLYLHEVVETSKQLQSRIARLDVLEHQEELKALYLKGYMITRITGEMK